MRVSETERAGAGSVTELAPLVDCDVHTPVPNPRDLTPWLSPHWQEYVSLSGFGGSLAVARTYPPGAPTSGAPLTGPASTHVSAWASRNQTDDEPDPDAPRKALSEHLDRTGARYAVLNCFFGLETLKNPDLAAEMARGINGWLRERWLDKDERFRASLVVNPNDPVAAAEEIERVADDPRFVQVFLPVRAEQPYGHRRYFPLHDAAARHSLPLSIQFGGWPGHPPTPSGWSAYYLEDYVGMSQIFQTQVTSLIAEGVFARHPDMRVVLAEAGLGWVPSLLWRLDKEWKGLRREVPWVTELPSAYFRRHFRGTLQPIDVSLEKEYVDQLLEQIGSDQYLLYATDHPHRHAHSPDALLGQISEDLRRAIMVENAQALYGLGE